MDTLKTNSMLDVLLKRNGINLEVGNQNLPTNPQKDCAWNKLSRLEQTTMWLADKNGTKSHCPVTIAGNTHCDNCRFKQHLHYLASPYIGGIDLPNTGNIVISGKYGQGKTTLAFQLASACAEQGHIAIYFSLESRAKEVLDTYATSKYVPPFNIATSATHVPDSAHNQELVQQGIEPGDSLRNAIINASAPRSTKNVSGNRPDRLIFVSLRNLSMSSKEALQAMIDQLNTKYTTEEKQIKDLVKNFMKEVVSLQTAGVAVELVACYAQVFEILLSIKRSGANGDKVKMIVIDSLTEAFSTDVLDRFDIHRFMTLFKAKVVVGVFPLEGRANESDKARQFVNDAKYVADCVINLSSSERGDCVLTCLQVEKNRTSKHVLGKHLYKIAESGESSIAQRCLSVFPSLHYEFAELKNEYNLLERTSDSNLLGDPKFKKILPQFLTGEQFTIKEGRGGEREAQALTLTGQSGLYKSDIAINSLLYGLLSGQNGFIIRLNDNETFKTNGVRLNEHLWAAFARNQIVFDEVEPPEGLKSLPVRYELRCWAVAGLCANLFEIVFAKGAVQPEEWLALLTKIIEDGKIKRTILVDLKSIGVSNKFLVSTDNEMSGDMLLPTLTQMMKVKGVDLIYVASDSGFEASDREAKRARILANASIFFEQKDGVKLSGTFDVIQNQSHCIRLEHEIGKIRVMGAGYAIDHDMPMFSIG